MMKNITLEKTLDEFKKLILLGVVIWFVIVVNKLRAGTELSGAMLLNMAIGLVIISVVCLLGILIKKLVPIKIPAFAWASLLGVVLAFPWWPWHEGFLALTGSVSAGTIGTVILALAGVSIGTKLADIKKLSWKIVIVSIVVFCGTFFGSALIADLILRVQGII